MRHVIKKKVRYEKVDGSVGCLNRRHLSMQAVIVMTEDDPPKFGKCLIGKYKG